MATQQLSTQESKLDPRTLLHVRGLTMAFDGQQVLNGIDIDLHEGQVVLLRGSNGSGKTTLVNILTGYLTPDEGEIRLFVNDTEEKFIFPRRWWQDLNPWDHFLPERVAQKGIGRSWQETRLFQSIRLVDNIAVSDSKNPAESLLNVLFRPGYSQHAETLTGRRAKETLCQLGLKGRDHSSADKVSLGQAKRIALARAMGTGAQILFLDEPLAGLDGKGIKTIVNLLQEFVKQHKIAIVLVEHVTAVHHLLPLVDTIWDLDGGQVREVFIDDPVLTNDKVTEYNIGLQQLTSSLELIENISLPGNASLDIYQDGNKKKRENDPPILQLENLVVHRGPRLVVGVEQDDNGIDGINITLFAGDLAVLQAPNGWGKTTLLDSVAGIQPSTSGLVYFLGCDVSSDNSWNRARMGLHYFRSCNKGFPSLEIAEVKQLSFDKTLRRLSSSESRRRYGELSGGEKQDLNLTVLKQKNANVYMLDEPFSALDEQRLNCAISTIMDLFKGGSAILVAVPSSEE